MIIANIRDNLFKIKDMVKEKLRLQMEKATLASGQMINSMESYKLSFVLCLGGSFMIKGKFMTLNGNLASVLNSKKLCIENSLVLIKFNINF